MGYRRVSPQQREETGAGGGVGEETRSTSTALLVPELGARCSSIPLGRLEHRAVQWHASWRPLSQRPFFLIACQRLCNRTSFSCHDRFGERRRHAGLFGPWSMLVGCSRLCPLPAPILHPSHSFLFHNSMVGPLPVHRPPRPAPIFLDGAGAQPLDVCDGISCGAASLEGGVSGAGDGAVHLRGAFRIASASTATPSFLKSSRACPTGQAAVRQPNVERPMGSEKTGNQVVVALLVSLHLIERRYGNAPPHATTTSTSFPARCVAFFCRLHGPPRVYVLEELFTSTLR